MAKDRIDVIEPPANQEWLHRTSFFRDPEHNTIEIFADIHPRETLAQLSSAYQVVD
ncbi:hypothetical protein [uncultured Roseobacter sp.]|uniref:hypothetical protein n=1 Tax=uncultured Roseobacter sp. TaxID=114847 RepID=UPI0034529893